MKAIAKMKSDTGQTGGIRVAVQVDSEWQVEITA